MTAGVLLCWALTGDFFNDQLPKADLYILARILHDWNDEKVHALLSKISAACTPGKLCSSIIFRECFFFFFKNIQWRFHTTGEEWLVKVTMHGCTIQKNTLVILRQTSELNEQHSTRTHRP